MSGRYIHIRQDDDPVHSDGDQLELPEFITAPDFDAEFEEVSRRGVELVWSEVLN